MAQDQMVHVRCSLSSNAVVGARVAFFVRIEGDKGFDLTRLNTVQIVVTSKTPVVTVHEFCQIYTPALDRHAIFVIDLKQPGKALLDIRVLGSSYIHLSIAEFDVISA